MSHYHHGWNLNQTTHNFDFVKVTFFVDSILYIVINSRALVIDTTKDKIINKWPNGILVKAESEFYRGTRVIYPQKKRKENRFYWHTRHLNSVNCNNFSLKQYNQTFWNYANCCYNSSPSNLRWGGDSRLSPNDWMYIRR